MPETKPPDPTPRQGPPPEDLDRTPESTLPRSGQAPGKPDSTEADRAAESDEQESARKPSATASPQPVNYPPKLI